MNVGNAHVIYRNGDKLLTPQQQPCLQSKQMRQCTKGVTWSGRIPLIRPRNRGSEDCRLLCSYNVIEQHECKSLCDEGTADFIPVFCNVPQTDLQWQGGRNASRIDFTTGLEADPSTDSSDLARIPRRTRTKHDLRADNNEVIQQTLFTTGEDMRVSIINSRKSNVLFPKLGVS